MKYLFFDIECSNCFGNHSKICEFGYVLTDENFKVISKDAIPMSPGKKCRENRFDLGIFKREPGFEWAYDFDYYFNCAEFPIYYDLVKKLFEDKDTIIFGYAVDSDIRYLNDAFERYHLDPIDYDAYDVQKMMRYYSTKKESVSGLDSAFDKLCSKEERVKLQRHLSRDDAYMTMRVFQEICNNLNLTPLEMIELCDNGKYNSSIIRSRSHKKQSSSVNHKKVKPEGCVIWEDFFKESINKAENDEQRGKYVIVSESIKKDVGILKEVIEMIKDKGLEPAMKITGSNYFIGLDENDIKRMNNVLKRPYEGKLLSIEDLKQLNIE